MMKNVDLLANVVALIGSAGAAVFWLWASLIEVPNNIDTIVDALQRAGQLNALAAGCACVAAIGAAFTFARGLNLI